jgi:kumamolisin
MNSDNHYPLPGTSRQFSSTIECLNELPGHKKIEIILVLTDTPGLEPHTIDRDALMDGSLLKKCQDNELLQEKLAKVRAFARQYELQIMEEHLPSHNVVIRGTVAQLNHAFHITINRYAHKTRNFYGHEDEIKIPATLKDTIAGVLGLDDFPIANFSAVANTAATLSTQIFTPLEIASFYDIPAGFNCSGQCVGLLEFGGGYKARDIEAFAKDLKIPNPDIIDISVANCNNTPGAVGSNEVALDIQMAAAVAQKAKLAIYFAPNSPSGFYSALQKAVFDTTNKPSVISISWGASESKWSANAVSLFEKMLTSAKSMNITVVASTGDKGSSDGQPSGTNVQYPASSPQVIACGGTQITVENGKISSEVTWNNMIGVTGGGISNLFPVPSHQQNLQLPVEKNTGKAGRGIPDLAAIAFDIQVYMNGRHVPSGGTSAVSPIIAAFIAILNKKKGSNLGFLNKTIYDQTAKDSSLFRNITSGNNGAYQAGPGWDACTGLGSPMGAALSEKILK